VDVTLVVELEQEAYERLLIAANESGLPVNDYCIKIISEYLEVEGG
jgi:predicted HicB family RNase H-like nuclease